VITVAGTVVPVQILHRLALGVEPRDHVTSARIGGIRVDEELPGPEPSDRRRLGLDPLTVPSTLRPFEPSGGRYKLRHGPRVRESFTLRVHDPLRRYVPRRFVVTLWPAADLAVADEDPPQGPFIPVLSRVVSPWLLPGAAYRLPRTVTAIRGRVTSAGRSVRWPRIRAHAPASGEVLGHTHGDERGEFLLLLPRGGGGFWPPADGLLPVELALTAAPSALPPPTAEQLAARQLDPLADLAEEPVPRSQNPPLPGDLDNPLLRGEAEPADYVESDPTARPVEVLQVGKVFLPPSPYEFLSP
jgi:hypothetical protein